MKQRKDDVVVVRQGAVLIATNGQSHSCHSILLERLRSHHRHQTRHLNHSCRSLRSGELFDDCCSRFRRIEGNHRMLADQSAAMEEATRLADLENHC